MSRSLRPADERVGCCSRHRHVQDGGHEPAKVVEGGQALQGQGLGKVHDCGGRGRLGVVLQASVS